MKTAVILIVALFVMGISIYGYYYLFEHNRDMFWLAWIIGGMLCGKGGK